MFRITYGHAATAPAGDSVLQSKPLDSVGPSAFPMLLRNSLSHEFGLLASGYSGGTAALGASVRRKAAQSMTAASAESGSTLRPRRSSPSAAQSVKSDAICGLGSGSCSCNRIEAPSFSAVNRSPRTDACNWTNEGGKMALASMHKILSNGASSASRA